MSLGTPQGCALRAARKDGAEPKRMARWAGQQAPQGKGPARVPGVLCSGLLGASVMRPHRTTTHSPRLSPARCWCPPHATPPLRQQFIQVFPCLQAWAWETGQTSLGLAVNLHDVSQPCLRSLPPAKSYHLLEKQSLTAKRIKCEEERAVGTTASTGRQPAFLSQVGSTARAHPILTEGHQLHLQAPH